MFLKVKITRDRTTGYYTGQLTEIPEVISEGGSLEELKVNIIAALKLVLEVKAELKKARKSLNSSRSLHNKSSAILYELCV